MLYIDDIGRYFLMIKMSFFKPSKWKVQRKLIFKEINDLIIESIPIVAIFVIFYRWSCSNPNCIKLK